MINMELPCCFMELINWILILGLVVFLVLCVIVKAELSWMGFFQMFRIEWFTLNCITTHSDHFANQETN